MRLIQTSNYQEMSHVAAILALSHILEHPQATIGLATGRTPTGFYQEWVKAQATIGVSLAQTQFFHLDEYVGLDRSHPESMAHTLWQQLLGPLGIESRQIHWVDALTPQLEARCQQYEAAIAQAGGIDLQILGIGANGHIAFNEPGTPFGSQTHIAALSHATRQANAPLFTTGPVPTQAVTMGLQTIMAARRILLLASGTAKAQAVADMLYGPVTEDCPASILQFHPDVTVIMDQAAATLLKKHFEVPPVVGDFQMFPLDTPMAPTVSRILVTAPHPDDASIGCGATLARLKAEGHILHFASMTSGHRATIPGTTTPAERTLIRAQEAEQEALLFDANLTHLALPFYEQGYSPSSVDFEKVETLLKDFRPDIIFSAAEGDRHPAHRMSALVLRESVRRWCHAEGAHPAIWYYEGPWFLFERDAFNTVVVASPAHMALKNQGVQQHVSQISRKRYDQAAESLARFRAITTPESRVSVFGSELQDLGEAIEVFQRVQW